MINILLIDDAQQVPGLQQAMQLCSVQHVQGFLCTTSIEAENFCKQQAVHLVIINLETPGAFDFLRFARKNGMGIVALIHDTWEAGLAVKLLGVDFLKLPIETADLCMVIETHFHSQRQSSGRSDQGMLN